MNLRCFFGLHEWRFYVLGDRWHCTRCNSLRDWKGRIFTALTAEEK